MRSAVAAMLLASAALTTGAPPAPQCTAQPADRDDCYPWTTSNLTASKCMARGCCWDPTSASANLAGVPWCFYPTLPTPAASTCSAVTVASRLDCHPEPNAGAASCAARGCCWDASEPQLGGIAACFFPRTTGLAPASSPTKTPLGLTQALHWGDDARQGPYGNDPATVTLDVSMETNTRIRARLSDPADPEAWDVSPLIRAQPAPSSPAPAPEYVFETSAAGAASWGLSVSRPGPGGDVLFNSTPTAAFGGAVFERQYIELSTSLGPNDRVFGLGEHITPLELATASADGAGQTYTLFARDRGTPDHTAHGNTNLYGQHPVMYRVDPTTGRASAVVVLTSNALDVVLRPGAATFRVTGGVLDLYVLTGPTPVDVSRQYAELVGRPGMPPYFALGFHLCRWGYENATYFASIVDGMESHDLPTDAFWHDIDLYEAHRDFTMDPTRFPASQMGPLIERITSGGAHYGGIVDPAIQCDVKPGQYKPLDSGTAADVWIRNANDDGYATKGVWPGPTWFPDFFKPQTQAWWTEQHRDFRAVTNWSFLWYDMNEPATISEDASCAVTADQRAAIARSPAPRAPADALADAAVSAASGAPTTGPGFDPEWPPYLPGRFGGLASLSTKTLPTDSILANGPMYNTHSLYGWSESRAGTAAIEAVLGERPLLISRSTFPSHSTTGAGHWLGDNTATWHDLRMNVAGVLQFASLFQIPLVGADTCGFNGDTNAELCTRWMALSAMLAPFFRNHNSIGLPEQAPFVFGEPYTTAIRTHMQERMRLLPMWGTAFYHAHATGTPVVRPLWFDHPLASAAGADLSALDTQALVGPGLLSAPVVEQGASSRAVFLPPADTWFDWWTGSNASASLGVAPFTGSNATVRCNLTDRSPLFVPGGLIVPAQGVARNSTFARRTPFDLTVALAGSSRSAAGDLFWDDGKGIDTVGRGLYALVNFTASAAPGSGSVTASPVVRGIASAPGYGTIRVLGAPGLSASVTATVGGRSAPASFDAATGVLTIDATKASASALKPLAVAWTA